MPGEYWFTLTYSTSKSFCWINITCGRLTCSRRQALGDGVHFSHVILVHCMRPLQHLFWTVMLLMHTLKVRCLQYSTTLCGPGAIPHPSYSFTSPFPHLLLLSFNIFYFVLISFLTHFIYFLLLHPFHSTSVLPLHFQARCRGRQLFCVDFMLYVFLFKDACLFLSYLIYFCLVVW